MILKHFTVGFLEVNNYLLIDEISKEAVLIDCTDKNPQIEEALRQEGAKLKYILLTHGHFDHVLGVNTFKKLYGCKVLIHKNDEIMLQNVDKFSSSFGFNKAEAQHADGYAEENQSICFGGHEIRIIHTPGHSQGSVCYLVDDMLFSGDTLFKECVGRTDLYGGDFDELKRNIENKLFTLEGRTKVFPGHGEFSTIEHERTNNEFL